VPLNQARLENWIYVFKSAIRFANVASARKCGAAAQEIPIILAIRIHHRMRSPDSISSSPASKWPFSHSRQISSKALALITPIRKKPQSPTTEKLETEIISVALMDIPR
jgi:hypothetical protein